LRLQCSLHTLHDDLHCILTAQGAARMSDRNTPTRAIRVPDEIWNALGEKAKAEGVSTSEYVRRWLAKAAGVKIYTSPVTLKPGPKPTR